VNQLTPQEIANRAAGLAAETRAWLARRLAARWFPRDLNAAVAFLARRVENRPFALYGAGSHSAALLAKLEGMPLRGQLRCFFDRAATPGQTLGGLPVLPAAAALAGEPITIVLSHHEFEDGMRDDLLALGVPAERIAPIYLDPDYGRAALEKAAPPLRRRAATEPRDKPLLALVSARPRRIIDADAVARLQRLGHWRIVQMKMDRGESAEETSAFATVFDARNSLALCLDTIAALRPSLICVQEHYSSGNFLPMAVAHAFPETPVIGELYDLLALTFDDPYALSQASYWREQDVTLALAAERWPGNGLSGVITKEDGAPLDAFLHGAPALKFKPYPDRARFVRKQGLPGNPVRLVWAGAIAPSSLSPRLFGDNQLIDVFAALTELGFEVTAFTSAPDEATLRARYDDYLALASRTKFRIFPAVPRDKLIPQLAAEFDFGLMLGAPKPDTQQGISHQVTVSGKMFTYLAAGLPLIVGDYLEVMAGWTRDHGLGLMVAPGELKSLPDMIAQADYGGMLANVAAYRETRHLDAAIEALASFLARVANGS